MIHEVYRNKRVHVLSERCSSCIFRSATDGRIQGVPPSRVAEMVQTARGNDSVIPCHQTIYEDDVEPAICRGYYDGSSDRIAALRVAKMLEAITFVDPPGGHCE